MNKNHKNDELTKEKDEIIASLRSLDIAVGHSLFAKKDKSLVKKHTDAYAFFTSEIEALNESKVTVVSLDKDYTEIKARIQVTKEKQNEKQKILSSMYVEIGESLFENYSPVLADVFGKTYTDVCVEDKKIKDVHEKEYNTNDNSGKKGILSKLFTMAKEGASKTQVSLHEQKRENLLAQGAKKALESGKLGDFVNTEAFSPESNKLINDYRAQQEELLELKEQLASYNEEEKNIKMELEKLGASLSVQRCLNQLDKQIQQKHIEQDEYCLEIGHDYVIRYVSPDGDILVEFPKESASLLEDIQIKRKMFVSVTRRIEIKNICNEIETLLIASDSLQTKKEDNIQAIEKLTTENELLDTTIAENLKEKSTLEKKLAQLEKEEKNMKI